MGRVTVRSCTKCHRKYSVKSLDITSTCPTCGHVQGSHKGRPPLENLHMMEINPAFYQPGDRVVLPSRIPGKVAVVFPSKVVDVDVEYLTDLLREVEETLKNNMGVEGV